MSTELSARFYLNDSPNPADTFLRMINEISSWSAASGEWSSFKIAEGTRHNTVLKRGGTHSVTELKKLIPKNMDAENLISATTSFKCWRFRDGKAEESSVGLWVEAWGTEFGKRNEGDLRLGGLAAMTVFTVGPFCAVVDKPGDPLADRLNAKVEDNLNDLTNLIFRLIERLEPSSTKLYSGDGLFLPFNAHLVYHRTEDGFIEDLHFLADVWRKGLAAQQIPSFDHFQPKEQSPAFHGWRSEESRVLLWERFNHLLPRLPDVTTQTVQGLLRSGHFDNYNLTCGTAVLEYPFFLNSFLDRFYLELLESASPRPTHG